jgi:hypothetical protein
MARGGGTSLLKGRQIKRMATHVYCCCPNAWVIITRAKVAARTPDSGLAHYLPSTSSHSGCQKNFKIKRFHFPISALLCVLDTGGGFKNKRIRVKTQPSHREPKNDHHLHARPNPMAKKKKKPIRHWVVAVPVR